jgi:hypothetical protein
MTTRVIGIGVVGVLCAAGSVAALLTAVAVLDASGVLSISNQAGPSADLDRRFALAQVGYLILMLVAPLAGGFLLAAIAILVLLAIRWRAPSA